MKTIFLSILILFLLLISCENKKSKKCSRSYTLEHTVSVYPIKDSYNIGDTIWFEMNFSDVFDAQYINNFNGKEYNKVIPLQDFDFHRTFFSFVKITDTSKSSGGQSLSGWPSFTPVYQNNFTQWENNYGIEYKYNYKNKGYYYKLGIICNLSGKFIYNSWFDHYYSNAHSSMNNEDITPECEKEIIHDIRFPVNKQSNGTFSTNYHLFEQFMNPELENDIERFKEECFTFVVN